MTAAGTLCDDQRHRLRQQAQSRIMQLLKQLDAVAIDLAACPSETQLGADKVSEGQRALDRVIVAARGVRDHFDSGHDRPSPAQVRS